MKRLCDIIKRIFVKKENVHKDYNQIYITQNDKMIGIINGTLNYTIHKDMKTGKKSFDGSGYELMLPEGYKGIYDEWDGENSIFDVVIKRGELIIKLCDAVLLPRPSEVYHSKNVAIIRNFRFVSF